MATKAPALVDLHGQPLRKAILTEEISGPMMSGVRSIMQGHPAAGLTPQKLASLLLRAEQGDPVAYFELAEEMEEKDLHYLSLLNTRKRAVARIPITIEPADDSAEAKEDAKLIEDWLERDTLRAELFDLLDAIGKGVSFIEIIWETGDLWLPSKLKWRNPSWFEFDRVDGETPMLRGDGGQLEPLEFAKYIVHFHPSKSGLPVRGGLARAIAWGWMFKNYSIKDWVSFLEMYGQPVRVGRYDVGAADGDIRKLMRAVAQIGTDAAAVFPRTMDIEFIDGKGGAAPNELWRSMAEYIDEQVSKAVLGQTSSSDAKAGGLGSGQADLHGSVRDDLRDDDGDLVAATLNRDLIPAMVMLNRGPRKKYPRAKMEVPKPIDVKSKLDAAGALVPMGVKVDADEMREMAGLPAPKSNDAAILMVGGAPSPENAPDSGAQGREGNVPAKKAAPALLDPFKTGLRGIPSSGEGRAAASATGQADVPDAVDIVADELLGDWDEIFEAVLEPISGLLASASSMEDARSKLARHIETMDLAQLAERFAMAGFGAHLAGEIDAAADEVR